MTTLQTEMLRRVACGQMDKKIANDLNIPVRTVQSRIQSLCDILCIHRSSGLNTRVLLTRYAIRNGLVEP